MTKPLHILILEDNPADVELVKFELQEAGIDFTSTVVATGEGFIQELQADSYDLILSDYDLPRYNGALALAEAKRRSPDTPFILVTGAVTEDCAIEILTQGAKDYVLKSRLQQRLVSAVRRALAEAEELRARKQAEEELREAHRSLEERVRIRTAELEAEIGARRQVEEELWEGRRKLEAALASMTDAVSISDTTGQFIDFNDVFATFHRFGKKEECARKFAEYPDIIDVYMDTGEPAPVEMWALPRALRGETVSNAEYGLRRKDTGEKWVGSYSFGPIRNKDGVIVGSVVVGRDITEKKKVEEQLVLQNQTLSDILNGLDALVYVADMTTHEILFLNTYGKKQWGDAKGKICWQALQKDQAKPCQFCTNGKLVGPDGNPTPGVAWEFQNTSTGRWYDCRDKAIYWSGGRLVRMEIAFDITDRKRMEVENQSLQERLQRSGKMEALGTLAGGVAHDLNNVLGVLMGYSELLRDMVPPGDRLGNFACRILESAEKGASIVQDLLTLARRGVNVANILNLNGVITTFLKSPLFENIRVHHPHALFRTELDQNLFSIKGSSLHLEKTVLNLLANAAESLPGQGHVTIRTENRYLDSPLQGYDSINEGEYVVLTVSDTGVGIMPDDLGKVFEPFYTNKAMGRSGTGLGLAIVWGTVKDHDGYIDVHSTYGKGTTFTLYFPITREDDDRGLQEIGAEQYQGRGESILVIDDSREQKEMAVLMLTGLGYEVTAAGSGEEAVEYLKGSRADLLVLDMIMKPGIDGLETYKRILALHPHQKAIIVSGFSETDRVREAQRLGAGEYVKKPYLRETIGLAVRKGLDAGS